MSTGFSYNASTQRPSVQFMQGVQFTQDQQYSDSKIHNHHHNTMNMNMNSFPVNNNMQMPVQQQQQPHHCHQRKDSVMSNHCRTETDMSNNSLDSNNLSQSQPALPFDSQQSPQQSTHTPPPLASDHQNCYNNNMMQHQQQQHQHVSPSQTRSNGLRQYNNHNTPSRNSYYHRTASMNNGPCYNQQIVNGTIPFNCRHNYPKTNTSSSNLCEQHHPQQQQQPQYQQQAAAANPPVAAADMNIKSCNEIDSSPCYVNDAMMTSQQLSPEMLKSPSPPEASHRLSAPTSHSTSHTNLDDAFGNSAGRANRSSSAASSSDDEARNMKVTGLPRECTNNELRALFEFYFGPVISSVVMLNRRGQNRGYGFVLMQHQEHAEVALTHLEQCTLSIRGQRIGAHLSRKGEVTSTVIFIGNISHVLTNTMLHQALRQIGKVVQFRMSPGREYRSATVELKDVDAAVHAVQRFHGATHINVGEVCLSLPVPLYAKFTRTDDSRAHGNLSLRPKEDGHQGVVEGAIAASVPPPPGLLCGLWSDEVEQDEAVSRLVEQVRNLSRMKLPLKERTVKKYFHKFLVCPETPELVGDEFYALARHHQLEVYKALC